MQADTPRTTTLNKAPFVAPKGWSVRGKGNAVILEAPEGDSHIAFIDVRGGNADTAVAAAWAAYRPDILRTAGTATDRPARDGWEQIRRYEYQASSTERRTVFARAMRKGVQWTVAIYDMSDPIADKRDAQIEQIFGKLSPAGFVRESFAGRKAHRLDAQRIEALSDFIETAREQLDIPGVALGLIQDGEVVFQGGFGVRELGKPQPVDADTLFVIASNGKALTTLMLAKLVESGKLDWNTPVTALWPSFKLGDADTTKQVLVKHLVCACTGLPRQDLEVAFEGDNATAASTVRLLETVRPTSKFGELYQYSNLLAAAGGYLGGHVLYPGRELGSAYDAAMQSLVLNPLGMAATTDDYARALAGNHAAPHATDLDGRTVVASLGLSYGDIATRPSGSGWSNVRDMLRYVRMELAEGLLPDGRRYIAKDALLARRAPQVAEGSDEYYGMGLKIDRIWGVPVIHHGGSMAGFRSDMIWLPEHGVGAVILTNADSGGVLRADFRRRLLEVLFDGKPMAAESLAASARQTKEGIAADREHLISPIPAAAAGSLAARYRNAALGDLKVRRERGTIMFDFGGWDSEMATRKTTDGTLSFVTITPGMAGFEFAATDKGGSRFLTIRDDQNEYVFSEVR